MTVETYAPGPLGERAPAQRAADLIAWAEAASAAHNLAVAITTTAFVPEAFRGKPEEAAVAILMGAEVGLSPLQALSALYVVRGRPGMYARAQVALVQSRGHEVWTEASTPDRVVVCAQRAGSVHVERVEWTIERARAAGLPRQNPTPWRDHPEAMLYARAATDACRRIAADVLLGVPEDVAPDPDGASNPGPGATTTVQRRGGTAPDPVPPLPAPPDYTPPAAVVSAAPVRLRPPAPAVTLRPDVRQDAVPGEPTVPDAVPDTAPEAEAPDDEDEPVITSAQRARMHAEFRGAGMSREEYLIWASRVLEVDPPLDTLAHLRVTEASVLLDRIEAIKAARRANAAAAARAAAAEVGGTVDTEDDEDDPPRAENPRA